MLSLKTGRGERFHTVIGSKSLPQGGGFYQLLSTKSVGRCSFKEDNSSNRDFMEHSMPTILILAANPANTERLRLDEEVRRIEEGLDRSSGRKNLRIKTVLAPRQDDVRRAMLECRPEIVHFSGHGSGSQGLAFEGPDGRSQMIPGSVLSSFFRLFATRGLECVVLNACYSAEQAKAISEYVDFVVGIQDAIRDDSALAFSSAFYDAIGAGDDYEFAHALACNAIGWLPSAEEAQPILLPRDLHLVATSEDAEGPQAGSDSPPPSAGVEAPPATLRSAPATNLPAPPTPFIGRGSEKRQLIDIFKERSTRLVTLLGTAGLGKTRLSQEIGWELLEHFVGGCWFANLIEAESETGIAHEISKALGVPLASSQTESHEAIADLLRTKGAALVILDNFEQVAQHATPTVGYWLRSVPDAYFLTTSRIPLRLAAEQEYWLNPLAVPLPSSTPEEAEASESVQLFLSRARRFNLDFAINDENRGPIVEVCRHLEGNPLAIELAAASLRMLTPRQVLSRIGEFLDMGSNRDSEGRHSTLGAAIEFSFNLLNTAEKTVFSQLSVFRDGFFLEAAEEIVDTSDLSGAPPVFEILQSLIEQSLLRTYETQGRMRYGMFVAIATFARKNWLSQASSADQARLCQRWADYYLHYAEDLDSDIHSHDGKRALDRLALETENLFEIQEYFLTKDSTIAARAILALAETMAVRGPAPLRVPKLAASLDAAPGELPKELYVRLKTALSSALWAAADWNEAEAHADDAVEAARSLENRALAASALRQQAMMRWYRGYLGRAVDSYRKARAHFEELGSTVLLSIVDTELGSVLERLGRMSEALQHFAAAERAAEEVGDDLHTAMIHNRMGLAFWHHGHLEKGLRFLKKAEVESRHLGNEAWIAGHKTNQGLVLADMDRFSDALVVFEEAAVFHQKLGYKHWAAVNYGGWGRCLMMRNGAGDLEEAIVKIRRAERLAREVYYPENIAFHVGDLGRAYAMKGKYAEARQASREAVALERRMGAVSEHRHFCNLATLAGACRHLQLEDQTWEAVLRASWLAERVGIAEDHEIRRVREDYEQLTQLREELEAGNWPSPSDESCIGQDFEQSSKAVDSDGPIRLAGLVLEPCQGMGLLRAIEGTLNDSGYEYPWSFLEDDLRSEGKENLTIFGYGSLLNRESAERTLKPAGADPYRASIAFGIVRLFDYDMPREVKQRSAYDLDDGKPLERGLLNARFTGALTDGANGVLMDVPLDDIEALRKREVGYDLRPVLCLPWGDLSAKPSMAYVLSCAGRSWEGQMLSNRDLLPHAGYYRLCRDGAASISEAFLDYWLDTTFLADGETSARAWEKS